MRKYNGIVVFGEMGSGKDTFAELLCKLDSRCSIYNIGFLCREFMKISKVNPKWNDKRRELGQLIADKAREVDINIFNDYTYSNILEKNNFPIVVGGRIVSDYNYWKEKGFLAVGITVDYEERVRRLCQRDKDFNIESMNHNTERNVKNIISNLCEVTIDNNLDLKNLQELSANFHKDFIVCSLEGIK